MIRFRTLGVLDLRSGDGAELGSVLRQSKRLALLAYLAVTPGGFQRRDRLLAMFWPELDRDRARHALSQAIHYLRRSLGRDTIVGRGDEEVGIAPERLWCDVIAFHEAADRGDLEHALALYGGELLPALHVSDAPDFERWLDAERSGLAKRAAAIAWTLAEQRGAASDGAAAAAWARRAVALAPWDESGLRRLIALLDALGDRAGAIEAYHDFARRLEAEFEVEPAAETRELIETIRGRVESVDPPPPPTILDRAAQPHEPQSQTRPDRRRPPAPVPSAPQARRVRPIWWAAAAVLATAMLALMPNWPGSIPLWEVEDPRSGIAVLYFHDQTGGGEYAFLADALTTELIRQLHHQDKIEVVSAQGVRQFRGSDVAIDSVARALDVAYVVSGSVTQANDQLQVYVELTDARGRDRVIDRKTVDRPASELFGLVADVSREVVDFLRPAIGQEIRLSEWQAGTKVAQAWQLVQRAEKLLLDAPDAQSSGGVAARRMLDEADDLLARASRLDPAWSEPVVLRGWVAERQGWICITEQDFQTIPVWLERAELSANEALLRSPGDARAFELRGTVRQRMWLLAPPSPDSADVLLDAAERDLREALKVDPGLPRARSTLSAILYTKGEFREANLEADRALRADAYLTDVDEIVMRLFATSFEQGNDVDANDWCNEVEARMPDRWAAAYCKLILLGWGEDGPHDEKVALHTYATFGENDPPALRALYDPMIQMLMAGTLARLGMKDSARAVIQQARSKGENNLELLEYEAAVLAAIGDYDAAADALERYFDGRPTARRRVMASRMFGDLPMRMAADGRN